MSEQEMICAAPAETGDTLPTLAYEIRFIRQHARKVMLESAVEIGRRLTEAKAQLKHGEWLPWLANEVDYSETTASRLMRLFKEYGGHISGDSAYFATLQNMSISNALLLLSVPENERSEFAETNNVAELSVTELEAAIRERDELKRALNEEQQAAEGAAITIGEKNEQLRNMRLELSRAEALKAEKEKKVAELAAELDALRSRPVDVAVQEPDPEEIDRRAAKLAEALLADADAKYAAEKEKLLAKIKAVESKRDKLEQAVKDAEKRGEKDAAPFKAEAEKARLEAENARAEAEKLRRELAVADADTTAFKLYFEELQRCWNLALGLANKAEAEKAAKLRAALRALGESFLRTVTEGG